jgi:hypothetical protein
VVLTCILLLFFGMATASLSRIASLSLVSPADEDDVARRRRPEAEAVAVTAVEDVEVDMVKESLLAIKAEDGSEREEEEVKVKEKNE